MTIVAVDGTAEYRLHTLGIAGDQIIRTLLRADAEAKHTTGLEPPTAEGTTRYFKTVRFLREELVPLGWGVNDGKNFCRTVHPSHEFSIVTSSGDEATGVEIPGRVPRTKNPKGELTAIAVRQNADQGSLDLGEAFDEPTVEPAELENVWFLLQRVTPDYIYAELSLPVRMTDGMITEWEERILLPRISRHEPESNDATTVEEPPASDGDAYSVDVAMR
ncbi:hypothetical protein [Nocardioides cavernaquae]|uniref:Uncharacterized protein n=1 Tax=Nocardioides cavernaquae TaxID=2321396 RepID=A0A3A5HC16_9ACTN|nr:hypothetical protein [Nocardioides cavernaquae]RJS47438.1 hypothetical protein D4739_15255 [Nocardioides cavernaquae]